MPFGVGVVSLFFASARSKGFMPWRFDVAVAHRENDVPGDALRVEHAARLAVDGADLEDALEAERREDLARPLRALIEVLVVRSANAFAAARDGPSCRSR